MSNTEPKLDEFPQWFHDVWMLYFVVQVLTEQGLTNGAHVHNCIDFPDHSAGSHLCECGVMWRGEHPG
jgi:hypothetical protein